MLFAHTLRRLRQSLQAGRVPERPRKPLRRRLELENLEARALLSCNHGYVGDIYRIICDVNHDTITISTQGSTLLAHFNGVNHNIPHAYFNEIQIFGRYGDDTINAESIPLGKPMQVFLGAGNDTVNVSPTARNLNNIAAALDIKDLDPIWGSNGGQTTIRLNDQANAANHTYTLEAPALDFGKLSRPGAAQITYEFPPVGGSAVTLNGGSGATTFNVFENIGTTPTVLNTGTGVNTVNVHRTYGPLTINGQNGLDFVNLGQSSSGVLNFHGPVHVTNTASRTALTIDDSANPYPRTATLTDTSLTGLPTAPITWVEQDIRSLQIKGNGAGNTFTVTNTPENPVFQGTTLYSGTGADTVNVRGTGGALTVQGQTGLNTVEIGNNNSMNGILGPVSVQGAADSTTLTLRAFAAVSTQVLTMSATGITGLAGLPAVGVNWASNVLRSLTVRAGSGGNTIMINDTPTALFGGIAFYTGLGQDTVSVRRTSANLTLDGQNMIDTVTLGNAGNARQLAGTLHVTNLGAYTALTVDDSADAVTRTATLSATSLSGLASAQVTWGTNDLRSLTLSGGSGGNTFTINGTPSHPGFLGATLNAGSQSDTIRVRATSRPLTVNAGAGSDTIQVGSTANKLDGIQGDLTIVGGAHSDTLTLNDTGNLTDHGYSITASAVYRGEMAAVSYSAVESLAVNAGLGIDFVWVYSTAAGTATALHGGGGLENYLLASDEPTSFAVTGLDAGQIQGAALGSATFSQFGILWGGAGDDTFSFANGGSLSGIVYAGGGSHNKLDYSACTTNVYANLSTYEATGMVWAYGIQDITGGAGHDILVGDDQSNALVGGAGRDILIGGGVSYTFNSDALEGGAGDDMLIAGWTWYDWDAASLQWFRDVWAGGGTYAQRVAALSPYLNADTVYSNWAPLNVLQGGGDLDWFFVRTPGDSHDGGAGEDIVALLY